jgi:hypothetical protein
MILKKDGLQKDGLQKDGLQKGSSHPCDALAVFPKKVLKNQQHSSSVIEPTCQFSGRGCHAQTMMAGSAAGAPRLSTVNTITDPVTIQGHPIPAIYG